MDIEIIEKKENKLLDREEIYAIVKHPNSSTPNRIEIRNKIAAILGTNEKLVIIRKILSSYGKSISRVWAHVYKDEETLKKLEPKVYIKKESIS